MATAADLAIQDQAAAAESKRGNAFLELLKDWPAWAQLRVEQVDLLGFGETSVTSTLTFDLQTKAIALAGLPEIQLPVAYLTSNEIRDMEVRDEDGRRLPILSILQSNLLGMSALSLQGREAGGGESQAAVDKVLSKMFGGGRAQSQAVEDLSNDALYWKLRENSKFTELADELLNGRYLVVVVPPVSDTNRRGVLQLTYRLSLPKEPVVERPSARKSVWFRRWLRAIGASLARFLRPLFVNALTLPLPTIGLASDYEVAVNAPPGLVFRSAKVSIGLITDATGGQMNQVSGTHNEGEPENQNPVIVTGRQIRFAATKVPRKSVAIISAGFTADPDGILRSAFYISALTSIALAATLLLRMLDLIRPTSDQSAAVVLTIPALLVTYVVTVQAHPFAGQISHRVTGLIYATAVISILAAAALALSFSTSPIVTVGSFVVTAKRLIWGLLAIASVFVTGLLWVARFSARSDLGRGSESILVDIVRKRLGQGRMRDWQPYS